MKVHTSNLKTALKTFPLQIDEKITYGSTTLTNDEIIEVAPHYEGNLLKSMMKCLDIEASVDIPKDTIINYQKGILVNNDYEYLNYGDYVVVNSEKREDTNSYLITCYDKLIYSAVNYVTPVVNGAPITYPITIADYLEAICTYLGLTLKSKVFKNADLEIPAELYSGLGYKFRDVLDEISQCTGGSICLNLSNQVEVRTPIETSDTIDEDLILDVNAKFGEKYGPINSIVLSRSAESDNVYLKDDESIAQNGLCELKIVDNQIMNDNNRSDYLQGIADNLFGLEFYTNDFTSQGVFYYDFLDIYNVSIDNTTYKCIMLNDDVSAMNGTENIFSNIPDVSETDYSKADTTDKKINQAYIIVNKMEQKIQAKVSKDEIIAELNLAIEDGQGVINAKGNTFILDCDNAKIDEFGNAEFENIDIRKGKINLTDSGEESDASITITQQNIDNKTLVNLGDDLSDATILFNFKNLTYSFLEQFNDTEIMGNFGNVIYIKLFCIENNNQKTLLLKVYDTTNNIEENYSVLFENDILKDDILITMDSAFGNVYGIPDDLQSYIYEVGSITERETKYYGTGQKGDVFPNHEYTSNEITRLYGILDGIITPTSDDYELFDLGDDGVIDSYDGEAVERIYNWNINSQTPLITQLDYRNMGKLLSIGSETLTFFRIGFDRIYALQKIEIHNDLSVGITGSNHNIFLNGTNIKDIFVNKNTPLFYTQVVSLATGLSVNANTNTATATYTLSPRSGYKPITCSTHNLWGGQINLWYLNLDTPTNLIYWRVRNVSSSNLTNLTIQVKVLFVRSDLL